MCFVKIVAGRINCRVTERRETNAFAVVEKAEHGLGRMAPGDEHLGLRFPAAVDLFHRKMKLDDLFAGKAGRPAEDRQGGRTAVLGAAGRDDDRTGRGDLGGLDRDQIRVARAGADYIECCSH
jgi:hypothetical protein